MALAAPWTGEVEMSTIAGRFEPLANINDAAEALLLGFFAGLIEALFLSQNSGLAVNRLAERLIVGGNRVAPVTAAALRDLANNCAIIRTELLTAAPTLTVADLEGADAEAHNFALNGPVH